MATYLDRILDRHRADAAADERRTEDLVQAAGELPPTRGFRSALLAEKRSSLALAGLPACGSDSSNDDTDEVDAAVAEETPDGEGCEHLAEGPAVSVTAAV
nr:hypothetical protein [Microthrixaceae bacterium]